MKIKKLLSKFVVLFAVLVRPFSQRTYDRINTKRLKWLGVDISSKTGEYSFISPSVFVDGSDYRLIHIGKKTVISNDVILLTHDASIKQGLRSIGKDIPLGTQITFLKDIYIGDNCFIGIRSVILPGAKLGKNTIVAAGAVVSGKEYPDDVILAGVPAQVIGNTKEWANLHLQKKDYVGAERGKDAEQI